MEAARGPAAEDFRSPRGPCDRVDAATTRRPSNSAIGGVDAVKTDQIDKLRLLLRTLASQAHFKTENADIRLDMKDTVVFTEKQVDDSWARFIPSACNG